MAQENNITCGESEDMQVLDFWVGEWEVFDSNGKQQIGKNRIEKILNNCTILEHWEGASGSKGKSLFYYYPAENTWKQVWVTENPFRQGGVKEKSLVQIMESGATIFQGKIELKDGSSYLDRTILTPITNEWVEQIIEISTDNGENWMQVFQGIYKPAER